MGRELCLFLALDAAKVPLRERQAFVATQVRRAAPFSDPEHDTAWFGDHAAVWYWSRSRVRDLAVPDDASTTFRSESCFRGEAVVEDTVQLLALVVKTVDGEREHRGYEARIWRQGRLAGNRWWAELPDPGTWQTFLRGGGLDPSLALPKPEQTALRDRPLGYRMGWNSALQLLRGNREAVVTAASSAVLMVFAWQVGSVLAVNAETRRVEQAAIPMEQELETIITARARADEATASAEALMALRPPASQIRLMVEVQSVTPGGGWAVTRWHQPGPDMLEVTFKGSGLDAAQFVAAWEESPLFEAVSPATGSRPDELMITARLTRPGDPA